MALDNPSPFQYHYPIFGVWRSLVACGDRDAEVPGSSPGTPTQGHNSDNVVSFFVAVKSPKLKVKSESSCFRLSTFNFPLRFFAA